MLGRPPEQPNGPSALYGRESGTVHARDETHPGSRRRPRKCSPTAWPGCSRLGTSAAGHGDGALARGICGISPPGGFSSCRSLEAISATSTAVSTTVPFVAIRRGASGRETAVTLGGGERPGRVLAAEPGQAVVEGSPVTAAPLGYPGNRRGSQCRSRSTSRRPRSSAARPPAGHHWWAGGRGLSGWLAAARPGSRPAEIRSWPGISSRRGGPGFRASTRLAPSSTPVAACSAASAGSSSALSWGSAGSRP